MRIVSKAELMRMPKGTLFADYHNNPRVPWPAGPEAVFDSVSTPEPGKEPTDFFFTLISSPEADDSYEMMDRESDMADNGTAYPVGLYPQREGLYDPNTRYLVWEPEDVARIINLLRGGDDEQSYE